MVFKRQGDNVPKKKSTLITVARNILFLLSSGEMTEENLSIKIHFHFILQFRIVQFILYFNAE